MNETADRNETRPPAAAGEWERDTLARLAFAALSEQRRARRWNNLFKFGLLAYLVALLVISSPDNWLDLAPTEALATVVGDVANPGFNVANYSSGADWNGEAGNVMASIPLSCVRALRGAWRTAIAIAALLCLRPTP